MKKIVLFFILIVFILSSCGYFNLFYNAKKYYNKKNYEISKEKCEKILKDPDLKYLHDDANFLLAKIKKDTDKNSEALYYLKEIVTNYPESKYYDKSVKLIVEIYYYNNEAKKIYEFLTNIKKSYRTGLVKYYYAKSLFNLKKIDSFTSIVKTLPKKGEKNIELWALYSFQTKNYQEFNNFVKLLNSDTKKKLLSNLYFKSFNKKIFNTYLDNTAKYKFINSLLYPEINFNNLDSYSNKISNLSPVKQINLYIYLLENALEKKLFEKAHKLASNIKVLKEKYFQSSNIEEYILRLNKSFVKYNELPENWIKIFTDNKNFYLFSENDTSLKLYILEDSVWSKLTMINTPESLPDNYNIVWDKTYKRWIFLEPNTDKFITLERKNYNWDSITLEGDSLSDIPETEIINNKNLLFLFYKMTKITKLEIESDTIKIKDLNIIGYIPSLKEYSIITNQSTDSFILLGGEENGIKNNNAYVFNCINSNKWNNIIVKSNLDLQNNVIKSFYYKENKNIIFSWNENNLEKINNAYFLNYDKSNYIIDINEFNNNPTFFDNYYEFDYLGKIKEMTFFNYRDPNTSYNDLFLLKIDLNINSFKRHKSAESSFTSISEINNKIYYKKIEEIIKNLNIINNSNLSKKRIAEIYLIYFEKPKIAEQYYYEYLQNNPNDKKIFYTLGYLNYEYLNNLKKAEDYFKSFLLLEDPKTELYKNTQKYLEIIKNKKN
ncbi:MAG TPA: hypothetical protein VKN74_04585 [Candidatus Mcinerneyibacterium sp.]|nr:hypothetical protein [Candidatus Mcinerneyibacterium sp.]